MGQSWLALSLYLTAINLAQFTTSTDKHTRKVKEEALKVIDGVYTSSMSMLCVTDPYRSVPIEVETSKYDNTRQKVDMAALLLQELGANHHNRGLADALSRSLLLSDQRVLKARVLTLNVTSGQVVTPAAWHRAVSDLTGPQLATDAPRVGIPLDPDLPWYQQPGLQTSQTSPKFMESPANASYRGWWTYPYYSCAETKWLISYSISVPPAGRHPLRGFLSVDVDLMDLDLNQCDEQGTSNEIASFYGTHKCHNSTTKCVKNRLVHGWQRGGYHCRCRQGFYYSTQYSREGFDGTLVETAWTEKENNISEKYDFNFQCYPCAPGCLTCTDSSPCLALYNWPFRITLLVVSLTCAVLTLCLICYVFKHHRLKVFKVASPTFLAITLSGCSIMYMEMAAIFPVLDIYSCIATKWSRHLGFCITYTALLMKTWRVSLTYRVKSAHKVKLTDKQLLQWMFPILLVMVIYLGAWSLSDPPTAVDLTDGAGLRFKQCTFNWWDHSIAIGEVLFLAWGIRVCYNVRNAESFYNEAHLISYAIYNIALVNIAMVAFHVLLFPQAGPDIKYLLGFIRTQLSTTVTIALVFGPKVIRVLRGQGDQWDNRARARGVTASFSLNGIGLVHEETADLFHENEELKEEIQKLAGQIEFMRIVHMETNNRHLRARPGSYFQTVGVPIPGVTRLPPHPDDQNLTPTPHV